MTIVAMGTSAPECAVSISASLHGSNGMAISNVIGSNIFNLLVVCGVCALFQPLEIKKETLKREFPFSVLVAVIIGIMGLIGMKVGHVEGIILVVLFAIFLYGMVRIARNTRKAGELVEEEEIKDLLAVRFTVFSGHLFRMELDRPDGQCAMLHSFNHTDRIPSHSIESLA